MDSWESINVVLVDLFRKINELEENRICTDKLNNVTLNEIHVIEAIGIDAARNMSAVAKSLGVTTGTLTISVNSLVKKGLVDRVRSEEDRRVVLVSLTDLGKEAFLKHEVFHKQMIASITSELDDNEIDTLAVALSKLKSYFEEN